MQGRSGRGSRGGEKCPCVNCSSEGRANPSMSKMLEEAVEIVETRFSRGVGITCCFLYIKIVQVVTGE